jgi:hypothetical protein
MKKLFALLVVSGMVFVSCNNTPKEEAVQDETTMEQQDENAAQDEAAQMETEEAPAETPAE